MAVKSTIPKWYDVFGSGATGNSALQRAETSNVRFVRSQDELGLWNSSATGRYFKAKEALLQFGEERLRQVYEEGAAVLPPRPSEPSTTLRERRESLGLTQTDLVKFVGLSLDVIARAESPDYTSSIHDLTRLTIALGLDDAKIGFQPGANGDNAVAVRLKAWRDRGATARTIATLSDVTWVLATQQRLQKVLTPHDDPRVGFQTTADYGNGHYPAWDVASDLAKDTRRLLGISANEPIASLRTLCRRLAVPLVHAELPQHIAGATLATGNARGIVVNVSGNDKNVWVQRATIAHELGHLLFDPAESLNTLVVDDRRNVEVIDRRSREPRDWVEARANAFAVELLAPREAVREYTGQLDVSSYEEIGRAIRRNMERFGLSVTAMRYHLRNSLGIEFDFDRIPYIDPSPTDEWKGREAFTDDFFAITTTPIDRRGEFAGIVARAEKEGWLSDQAAALYLNTSIEEYNARRDEIIDLFAA